MGRNRTGWKFIEVVETGKKYHHIRADEIVEFWHDEASGMHGPITVRLRDGSQHLVAQEVLIDEVKNNSPPAFIMPQSDEMPTVVRLTLHDDGTHELQHSRPLGWLVWASGYVEPMTTFAYRCGADEFDGHLHPDGQVTWLLERYGSVAEFVEKQREWVRDTEKRMEEAMAKARAKAAVKAAGQ